MKSINSHSLSGRSLGFLLSLVLAGSAYAGPSPQFSHQTHGQAAPAAVSAPAAAAAIPAMACTQCQTRVVGAYSATNSSGKWAPHAAVVGVEHDCASCRGAIATVRGRTTNTMTVDCPVCARAQPACCTANG